MTSFCQIYKQQNNTLEFSIDSNTSKHDDTPVRPWNTDLNDKNYLNKSSDRWKQIRMLDQSSHIIEEIDETNHSLITSSGSIEEALEAPLAAPDMPTRHENK